MCHLFTRDPIRTILDQIRISNVQNKFDFKQLQIMLTTTLTKHGICAQTKFSIRFESLT